MRYMMVIISDAEFFKFGCCYIWNKFNQTKSKKKDSENASSASVCQVHSVDTPPNVEVNLE